MEHTVPHHTHNIEFICLQCLSLCHHNLILNQNNTFVVKSKHAHIIAVILQLNYTLQGGNGTNLYQLADLSFAVQSVAEGSSVLQARRTSDTRQTTVTHCEGPLAPPGNRTSGPTCLLLCISRPTLTTESGSAHARTRKEEFKQVYTQGHSKLKGQNSRTFQGPKIAVFKYQNYR